MHTNPPHLDIARYISCELKNDHCHCSPAAAHDSLAYNSPTAEVSRCISAPPKPRSEAGGTTFTARIRIPFHKHPTITIYNKNPHQPRRARTLAAAAKNDTPLLPRHRNQHPPPQHPNAASARCRNPPAHLYVLRAQHRILRRAHFLRLLWRRCVCCTKMCGLRGSEPVDHG